MSNDQYSFLRSSTLSNDEASSSVCGTNPWDNDETSLGALRRVLCIGKVHGYANCTELDHVDREDVLAEAEETFVSIKLIKIMKEMDEKTKQLKQVNLEIQKRLLDKETKDITHQDVLAVIQNLTEERVDVLNSLNGHLQSIVHQKDRLIGRLQQPYVGDSLKIEANYKQYASQVFPQLVPILSNLNVELGNIEWNGKVDLMDGQLESMVTEVSGFIATLQSRYQAVCDRRDSVAQLYTQYTGSETS